MDFILEQSLFYFAIVMVLFVPGWFLMRAIFSSPKEEESSFGAIEKFVISFGLSIMSVDFLMILMSKLNILLTQWSIILMVVLFSFVCYLLANIFKNSHLSSLKTGSRISKILSRQSRLTGRISAFRDDIRKKTPNSNKHTALIILILFLTIFIKTIYLQNTIFPTSTDLGHHMYWSQQISQTGKIPIYEKIKLKEIDNTYQLTEPQPIADFIIGEHLIFAAIGLISGISFVSYFPSLILFLVNIMGLLAIFILAIRLFDNLHSKTKTTALSIATLALLLLGPLWAISSPQAKFVSGGVIGNLFGNLLIPLCLYFYFRAFSEKNSKMLTTALFLTMGLFYTHHLSGFVFLFIVGFIVLAYTILQLLLYIISKFKTINSKQTTDTFQSNAIGRIGIWNLFKSLKLEIRNYIKLIFSPSAIIFLLLAICYLLFIYTPAYLQTGAVDTAVGAVTKTTRAGLSFTQFKYAVGEPRLVLSLFGLVFLLFKFFKKNKTTAHYLLLIAFLFGWFLAVTMMTLKPQWLNLNIPSGRLGNYTAFPIVILGAYALHQIFYKSKKYISSKILIIILALLFTNIFTFGFYDNSQSLSSSPNVKQALQTFHASNYLNPFLKTDDLNKNIALKDHNYLKADAWIKLFFMQDYSLPFSRSYFKRYNDPTKPREMCTLWMISEPTSPRAQKCYNETNTKFIIINPNFDSAQFDISQRFWKIYTADDVAVYYKFFR